MSISKYSIVLVSLLLACNSAQAANLFAGKSTAAAVCSQCHGVVMPGAEAPFPVLAGRDASYLRSALKQYRDKTRIAPLMNNIAAGLSDADIANVAAYYAKLKP